MGAFMSGQAQRVVEKLDAIEHEMRSRGVWQVEPLPQERYEFRLAFAMDTMAFIQWLQFVFIVRVRSLIEAGGPFPSSSQVGIQARREFDGQPEAATLVTLLSEFDALFGGE
jgi:uncharacterized protein YqcC (DUF446 family)